MRSETFTLLRRHSAIMNEGILKMRGPRPANGRAARNYGQSGSFSNGRLGMQTEGLQYNVGWEIRVSASTPLEVLIH